MTYRRLGFPVLASAVIVVAGTFAVAPVAGASSGSSGVARQIYAATTTSYSPAPAGTVSGVQSHELAPSVGDGGATTANARGVNRSHSSQHGGTVQPALSTNSATSSASATFVKSFNGLNHHDQRTANHGNQFSLEPPDQGLCAGNGFVVEFVNDVMRIYSTTGTPISGVEDLNTFYGYPAQIVRATATTPRADGPFVTDPSCYFDSATNHWFADVLTLDVFSDNGDFTGTNHLDIAVSAGGDPTGSWTIYRLPVQDDGTQGTPNHGCTGIPGSNGLYGNLSHPPTNPNACLGDYPHIGADANGIYLSTNEYSLFGDDFHGAQIYAFPKAALAAQKKTVSVTQFDTHGMDNGNSGFTVWPAIGAGDVNSTANNGTEYFMSSNAADEAHGNGVAIGPRESNQLLVWSITNTHSLGSGNPTPALSHVVLTVGQYSVPARSVQKSGSTPLVDCLNYTPCAKILIGGPDRYREREAALDSNDTRMQQVMLAGGKLWAALDTASGTTGSQAGIEWFVVNPSAEGGPALANNGFLEPENRNVIYPAVAVNNNGVGVMAFTVVGPDDFPSAGYAAMDANGPGTIQLAQAGLGPDDGFTGTFFYNAPNPPRPRWGDYGAAVVDGGNVWMASEYIGQTCTLAQYEATPFGSCGGSRTVLANWYTRITEVTPVS